MRPLLRTIVVAACLASLWPGVVLAGDVSLSIRDGRVTLVARDATVRQILTEWARVGRTAIVNVERVPGGPLTLELTDMPESQALGIVLRAVGGFMAAPRPVPDARLSRYDRIVVMPVVATAPPQPAAASPRSSPPPSPSMRPDGSGDGPMGMGRRRQERPGTDADDAGGDDEPGDEPRNLMRPPFGQRPSAPSGDGQQAGEQAAPPPPVTPGLIVPGGSVARPGQVVPVPAAPTKPPGVS